MRCPSFSSKQTMISFLSKFPGLFTIENTICYRNVLCIVWSVFCFQFKELMMQLDGCDEDENGEVIARPFYYLNKPSLSNKYQASATIDPRNHPQGGAAATANHSRNSHGEDAGDSEQQILKNASFIVSCIQVLTG